MSLLTWADTTLFRAGEPHRILGGAVHYFRVHPDQWRDRLERLAALGANTVDTYVAWNFHQQRPDGAADFTGWRDLGGFVRLAQEVGLDVIVRPGPYICAEWDNGGLPSWLTARADVTPRTSCANYTKAVASWFDQLIPVLAPLQADNGGPIVAVQVENEYGSYGDDTDHLSWLHSAMAERGIVELMFTADGGSDYFLDGGALPGVLAAATYGSGGADVLEVWRRRRPGEHMINIEFWDGWFDHWGEHHHVRGAVDAAEQADETLAGGGSVCLYMAHGGTNFGLWAGANTGPIASGGPSVIQPSVTSYDYDAPIAEDGTLTDKFHLIRDVFARYRQGELPPVPTAFLERPIQRDPVSVPVRHGDVLLAYARSLPVARNAPAPRSFEQLGLDHGLVLYSATTPVSSGDMRIRLLGLHDRATVFVDGVRVGVLDEATESEGVPVNGTGQVARLDILVENQGRVNYGPRSFEHKGILGGVMMNHRFVFGWEHRLLDLDTDPLPTPDAGSSGDGGGWSFAELALDVPGDGHLALPGFAKGVCWVNGFLLGRYWSIGPQDSLYVPAPLLHPGTNTIHVLELEQRGAALRWLDSSAG